LILQNRSQLENEAMKAQTPVTLAALHLGADLGFREPQAALQCSQTRCYDISRPVTYATGS
jgi:hypothetical protein